MSPPGKRVRMADVVRRRRTPRLDAVTVMAILIPLVTVGALWLVQQPPVHRGTHPPTLTRLTGATIVCPSASGTAADGSVSTATNQSGELTVASGDSSTTVPVAPNHVTHLPGSGPSVVQGSDALAPGLVGLRSGTAPLTAQVCSAPTSRQWFAGVGAGASHDSVIELVNPDAGRADVNITLYGSRAFTRRQLSGITVPAHRTVRLDLGKIAPRRMLLSAEVDVTRGRLAVHVLDSRADLLHHKVDREWVPAQVSPEPNTQLLGLPAGHGSRTLQLANPGDDVVRAEVKIVTGDTSFVPAGLHPVTIRPGATRSVTLTKVLDKALGDGAVGVEVSADGPVLASVLTHLAGDLAVTVPDSDIRTDAATLLPVAAGKGGTPVKARLYVSADAAGAATVEAYDASGKQLLHRRVAQQQGHTTAVELPEGTAFLRVTPDGTVIRGAVVLTGDGASVVPLHELLTEGLVPSIRPGLG